MSNFSADYSDLLHEPFDRIGHEVFDLLPAGFTQEFESKPDPYGYGS